MNFLNLTLQCKEHNILRDIQCIEKIDSNKLYKLLITSNVLKSDLRYKNVYENEKTQLINYLNNSIDDNSIKVKYVKNLYGRSLPQYSYGLHNIRRQVRHTICKDYYEDIDIINCHPEIYEQILKHNNIKCELLTNYNKNRDYYVNLVRNEYNIDRDMAKILFIRLLYGGSYDNWLNENNFKNKLECLIKFNKEMWRNNKIIVEHNKELAEWIKTKKQSFNDSTLVSYLLQEKEVQILEQLYCYSIQKKYITNNNVVLCADGMMILKENYNDNILKEFEELINKKFNINLKFINKKLDSYYSDKFIDDNIDINEIKEIDNIDIDIKKLEDNLLTNEELKKISLEINTLTQLNNEIYFLTIEKLKKNKLSILKEFEKNKNKLINNKNKLINIKNKIINNNINDIKKIILKNKKDIEKENERIRKDIEKENERIRKDNEKKNKEIEKMNLKKELLNEKITLKNENSELIIDEQYKSIFSKSYMNELKSYSDKKKYFELFVCKILRPSCIFLYLEKHKNFNNEQVFFSEKDISIAFREYNSGIFVMGMETKFIKEWLDDEKLLCYNKSDFIPYNAINRFINSESMYNLFNGYNENILTKYDINNKDKILTPFLELLNSICGDNELYSDYFIKFLAHMIQKPNEKIPICFILKGKQGTGKNLLLSAISNIIGKEYYISSSRPDDFFGQYAEGFYRKLLVNMNECESKDTFDFEGKIKSFITEDTININPKFVRPTEVRNIARIIITTNKPNPIPIDVKSIDRRFVVYAGTEKYLDKKYNSIFWKKLYEHFNKNEFIACLYDYLNNINIENYNWMKYRPITEEYKNMRRLYSPVEALFLEHYITILKLERNDRFLEDNNFNKKKDDYEKITLSTLCRIYNEFCKNNGFIKNDVNIVNIKKFRSQLESLNAPIHIYKSNGITTSKFNCDELITFLKLKNYIDVNDDEIIDNNIEEEIIDINEHDEYFKIN